MKKQQFRRALGIATGCGILLAALCLMGGCGYLFITQGGFSRETVAAVFSAVSLPVYLALGLAVLGFCLDIFQPRKGEKLAASRQEWLILQRLRSRTDISACAGAVRENIGKERRLQRIYGGISAGLAVIGCGAVVVFLLSADRFLREDVSGSVLGLLGVLAPCLAVNLAWGLVSGPKYAASCRREIDLLKPVAGPRDGLMDSRKSVAAPRLVLLAAAVLLLIWGFVSGGAADVLTKAINICTECIGLG